MRIILLSIAFIFCAFSAQSQVLKSAGVWYFLDVDSMTARPAVLPNGTELAYVVGTKTMYYWNRNTSTWTAYGSTFGRDSINFDASIVGSGTVSDPWGIDSTLFATIAAVGDSIAAAVANYFPLEGGTLTGTGGAGFIGLPSQVTAPGTPASGLNIFAQGSSFNWKGTDGFERQITSSLTGGRNYALPDINGTFALGTGTTDRSARWTGTNTLGAGSWSDNLTRLQAQVPVQFQSVTTAGLPTGVTGYTVYNTTTNGPAWYQGSRWAYALESTFARGTQYRIPTFDGNGQLVNSEVDIRGAIAAYSTYIGYQSGNSSTGNYNTVLGNRALYSNVSNTGNTVLGTQALFSLAGTNNNNNTIIGFNTAFSATTARQNAIIGATLLQSATSIINTVAIGQSIMTSATSADAIVAIGSGAMQNVGVASGIVAIGTGAVQKGTSIAGVIGIGSSAFSSLTTSAGYNVGIGLSAGTKTTTGEYNIAIGSFALQENLTGGQSVAIGTNTLLRSVGSFQVGIGTNALISNQGGANNVALGWSAGGNLSGNSIYSNGVFLGYKAGDNVNGGSKNIIIGADVDLPDGTLSNQLNIGNIIYGTSVDGTSNTISTGKIGIKEKTPFRDFTVNGEVRITDLTTDSPTRVVGADADGDLGVIPLAGGLSISGGALSSTWLKPELNAGNVRINANSNDLRIDSIEDFLLTSHNTSQLAGAYIGQRAWLNTAKTKYFQRAFMYDSRSGIAPGQMPTYWNLINWNLGSGDNFEWVNGITLDTTNNAFLHQLGGRYGLSYNIFRSQRSAVSEVYLDYARFDFNGTNAAENETNDTYHTRWNRAAEEMMMGLKDGGKFLIAADSTFIFDPDTDLLQLSKYGTPATTAAALSKTLTNYGVGFATDGTVTSREIKRDTTIYVTDADYDFSAAITTAQIASRFNRVIFWMTTTAAAGSDSDITLHIPDANLMQVEYLIHSVDEAGGFSNKIVFGTNNAVDSTNGLVTNYYPAAGDGIHIRAGLRSGVYKYRYSN